MSRTGTDKETRGDEYCLERTDFETCRKSVWSPERRERLESPIGDRLRVTRNRVMCKRLSQADRRRTVTKKAHSERKTRASIRTNPVLSKGHLQDVAHPATAKQAESDSETELYSVASLSETAHSQLHSQLLLTESVTQGREQTGSGKGRDPDGSRRRVGLEPTPTREQAELGRRTPHIGHNKTQMLRPKPVEQCRPCTRPPNRSVSGPGVADPFALLRGGFWWSRLPVQRPCRTAHSLWRALWFGMNSLRSCASSLDYRAYMYTDTFLGHLKTYLFVRAGVGSASE